MAVTMDGIFVNGQKATFRPEDILSGDASAYTEEIGTAVEAWLEENVTGGEQVTDTTLTLPGVPADAKVTGDKFGELKEDLSNYTGAKNLTYTSGGYIDCSQSVIDKDTVVSASNYKHLVDSCAVGDKYIVNGTGAYSAKSWCFIDGNGNRLTCQPSNIVVADMVQVIAPSDSAYFISNYRVDRTTNPFALKLVDSVQEREANIMGAYLYAIPISANSDLNDYTTAGNYRINSASEASSISNMPIAVAGRLTVITLNGPTAYEQIYQTSSGGIYWRTYTNGAWTNWATVADKNKIISDLGTPIATNYTRGISIPENSNLNDYTTAGNYYIGSVAIAQTIANIPIAVGGRLTVITTNASTAYLQVYDTSTGYHYWRNYVAGQWTGWRSTIDIFHLSYLQSSEIGQNSDLDDYKNYGNYYITNSSTAQTISNMPEKSSGRLTVFTLAGNAFVHQWFIASSNNWYIRELISNSWSKWKHLVDFDSMESYIGTAGTGGMASKGAYNALQAIIKNSQYDIAFANAFAPLPMKNYLGNTQNVHPKVLYFENGFGGHNFWMAYTPYPYSRDGYENPCIAYSDDGITWTNIDGNPLDDPNDHGYNSDTHLVYNENTGVLECWYRYVGDASQTPREETIYRQTTTDGLTWTAKEVVYSNTSGHYAYLLSPAVIIENSKYCIWVVNGDNGSVVDYYEAPLSNPSAWSKIRSISFSITDDGISVKPWHLDLIKDNDTYALLLMCRNGLGITNNRCSLFVATSSDNITYSTPAKVVAGADNWDKYMYRSSIVKVGDKYRIYYSASGGGTTSIYANAVWGMGITESDMLTSGYIGKYV